MRRLKDWAQADRDEFMSEEVHAGCSCFLCAPCGVCTHPGNPRNQEDDEFWIDEEEKIEEVVDVMDVTRRMFR